MVFGGFQLLKIGPVALGRDGRRATPVYSLMGYLNAEPPRVSV
jgi:hypothetical protein